jgi:hypothetical protein
MWITDQDSVNPRGSTPLTRSLTQKMLNELESLKSEQTFQNVNAATRRHCCCPSEVPCAARLKQDTVLTQIGIARARFGSIKGIKLLSLAGFTAVVIYLGQRKN